jgi:hypothetical protein
MVLASVVLLIAGINMLLLGIVIGGSAESRVAGLRAETLRAFLAAESGAHMVAGELGAGRTPPTGSYTLAGGESLQISVSGSGAPYTCTILARSGQARREIELEIE